MIQTLIRLHDPSQTRLSDADSNTIPSRHSEGRAGFKVVVPVLNGSIGGTVACESALKSAGTFLSRVRAPPSVPWPDGGP
ncbi:hypothetical protein PoB_007436700 [Plakobranchus ocellatus]|uniref:Uncharacterized protein n=1 Tax=Plakobranchus ocellatus TaxID=259542 RepID=A0AAV4DU46_9GAST|nr:hypothetical protein PoB_007436700 [Plakobranchus ocellatus]